MSKILGFAKKNIVSLVSILLAVVILISGIISYAKFITKGKYDGSSGAGFFSYSASIDGVSALSFTNTAFWGGSVEEDQSEENLVAMNAIRTVDFSINNFDNEGNINSVRTGYSMTFTAPQIFSHSLAFQIVNQDASAMIPQIVLTDIMSKTSFSTSESIDYNGEMYVGNGHDESGNAVLPDALNGNDLYFNVTKTAMDGMVGEYSYTATSTLPDGKVVISVVPRKETKRQLLHFRLWDISSIVQSNPGFNDEGGKLLAPLCIAIEEEQIFYDITVTMPAFELPAGVKTTNKHTIRLVPTAILDDTHLGGFIIDKDRYESTGDYVKVGSLYANQEVMLQSVYENIVSYSDAGRTHEISNVIEPVFGSVKVYTTGKSTTVKTVSPTVTETINPSITEGSADIYQVISDWSTVQDWEEDSRSGESGNHTSQMKMIEQKSVMFIVYEKTTGADHTITTYVNDAEEQDSHGNQTEIQLTETTSTITTVEKRPIGTITVVFRRESTRTDTYSGGTLQSQSAVTTGDATVYSQEESVTVPGDVTTDVVTNSPVVKTVYKNIHRNYKVAEITTKSVSYTVINDDGTTGETTYYTSSSPFSIYDIGGVTRHYYISQCFSKSYPLSVDITFEQRSASDD